MPRMRALTVFNGTDSSAAISCRDRFAGRHRSIFSSPALISPRDGTSLGPVACPTALGAFLGACAGRPAVDTVLSVSVLRKPCQRRVNHQDPVTTSYLTGGEPGPVAKARTAARGRARDSQGRSP